MKTPSKSLFYFSLVPMSIFLFTKIWVLLEKIDSSSTTRWIEFSCFITFSILFSLLIRSHYIFNKEIKNEKDYSRRLSQSLVTLSNNEAFYQGNIEESSKFAMKELSAVMDVDRASIWLYNEDKTSITLESLYVKSEDSFYNGTQISEKDYKPYFDALKDEDVIIADDVYTHPATSCFTETYTKPLGIKSMLDIPLWYRGYVIGVICIENLSQRKWKGIEEEFVQNLGSIYSFGYSIYENNEVTREVKEIDDFIDSSVLVSKADPKGKITYVNQKFSDVSGWSLGEVIGKDHNIVNSGEHPKEFWMDMYKTTVKDRKIWNKICTNRAKDGSLYYVDTFIKCNFDSEDNILGFMSIRQDITDLKISENEITNRMNAINQSNAVIEFDLNGNIKFANHLFLETLGYSSSEEIIGKHHSIFIEDDLKGTDEYKNFWENLKSGQFLSGEFSRKKKDGSLIFLQATYNPIVGIDGKLYRVMKIATDITESVNQHRELEKKNTYLEHSAKILRHDMHSGINTYMPRGLSALERRLTPDQIKDLKIEAPLKMIKEGLRHTQKVYKGVYEFTNLVKKDAVLEKSRTDIKKILEDYLSATAYRPQVILDDLGEEEVNEALFCTAIDNLIRNGLKYNDSDNKIVKIYRDDDFLLIEDNGRGMSQEDFDNLSKPYIRKKDQKETGTGLGLNICIAIIEEHGFSITCKKLPQGGTQIKIKLK